MYELLEDYKRSNNIKDLYFLGSHESAFMYFAWILRRYNYNVVATHLESRGRHKVFDCVSPQGDPINFYLKYDKDDFHSFSSPNTVWSLPNDVRNFFIEFPSFKGHGESINVEFLDKCISLYRCDVLVFVHDDGRLLWVYPKLVKRFCVEHKLYRFQEKKNNYLKANYKRDVGVENEQTYSFPLVLLDDIRNYFNKRRLN